MRSAGPYDWTRPSSPVTISRPAVSRAVEVLLAGRGALLLAGRGLGKSRFLNGVAEQLGRDPSAKVLRYREPPGVERSLPAILRRLARDLGVDVPDVESFDDVLGEFFSRDAATQSVCILFDEVDQYATPADGEPLGRRLFNHLESCRQECDGRLGVLAAGGLGAYHLRSANASPFTARAERLRLSPFTVDEIAQLAEPFRLDGRAIDEPLLLALHAASGGNPALVTYGLQSLWPHDRPNISHAVEAFGRFAEVHGDFIEAFRRSAMNPEISSVPERVLAEVTRSPGAVSRSRLAALCPPGIDATAFVSVDDALDILVCAGVVSITGSIRSDPVIARPVHSVLTLPPREPTAALGTLQARLVHDLERLLVHLHAVAPDFFRAERGQPKQIVPEAVFCATLAIALEAMGWAVVEREATLGAGRTDLKASHPAFNGEWAVVELKIWPRNDYDDIHSQIEGYWSRGVTAAAGVMLSDRDAAGWSEEFVRKCLARADLNVQPATPAAPIAAAFDVRSTTADGARAVVRHLLLRLARQ